MSEKNEESMAPSISGGSALDALENWYHVPVLGAVLAFMFWVRVQAWENFTQNGEVYFSGNDAYYHFRQVMYTVQNWPQTMPYDVWTGFPTGTNSGQFGTLFDQIVATAALVVGLGDPSQQTTAMTLLFAPVVFGALLAIPTYFVGKRLGGRLGGVFAAVILALLPGYFLSRTLAGAADHNGAEPLFQSLAVLATLVALGVAQREKPVYEQFLDRDVAGLRRVVGWSVLAGVATAAYMWMWPPGVLLVGIFGVFYLVKLTSDYYSGTSPDHVAVVGAISMMTTGLLMLVPLSYMNFSATGYTLLQPLFSFAVAIGVVFLAWLARQWDDRELDATSYPVAVIGILLVGLGITAVVLPDLFSMIQTNLVRFVGFSAGASARTIGEAQPFLSRTSSYGLGMFGVIFLEYGLAFFTALLGAAWILLRPHIRSGNPRRMGGAAVAVVVVGAVFAAPGIGDAVGTLFGLDGQLGALAIVGVTLTAVTVTGEYDAEQLLVVVWGAFITSAAFTQMRFNYYLVVPVVVLNAYVLKVVLGLVSLDKPASQIEDVDWYQVGTVVAVVLVVLVPIAAPVAASATGDGASPIQLTNNQNQQVPLQSATTVGAANNPGAVTSWDDAMEWMNANTPEQGDFGGAGNADQLDYYGTYSQTDDYDYPEGAYGVMSWWDYGHWMTVEGETIPVANPFQQHATQAANFLLSQNEDEAADALAAVEEDDAKTRYVAVDSQMILPLEKFSAPTVFYDGPNNFSQSDFYTRSVIARYQDGEPAAAQIMTDSRYGTQAIRSQEYYESMMVKLYRYHGSAKSVDPVVVDWRQNRGGLPWFDISNQQNWTRSFDSMQAAEQYAANDTTAQIGGVGSSPREYVEALDHYRMVGVSDESAAPANLWLTGNELSSQYYPTSVKLFERVNGATIEGTGPANTTLEVSTNFEITEMRNENGSAPTFPYAQRVETGPDGNFELTVPYSTTGYDEYGPENGYTNTSVRATGPYEITSGNTITDDREIVNWNATTHVTEGQVIGQNDSASTVDLERNLRATLGEVNNSTTSNETAAVAAPSTLETADETAGATEAAGSGPVDLQSPFGAAAAVAVPAVAGALGRRYA
ncbi:oligosaccharyl transferase, archaeosortase A system-associated [Halobacterium sp. KA-4]|uniref:oligosaccharyl transferase, archaeosortase A system-associated n=1 Tax=Halobacterium sp. KA-4 TaxID=2896367 RepID=UPI001E433658|nr:oligosaccharyl transferase, archaeosortase A system-associated [Halobacterium sp. KA-4]MCD2200491.1 oligosaccharyl transferase, archaeosortase A system-associated [Halobacterium sp. KA-4]